MLRTLLSIVLAATATNAFAQDIKQPIYRVNNEQPAPRVDPAVQPAAGAAGAAFDLVQRQGEHPLMPFIRMGKQSLTEIDTNIPNYTAVLTKQERIEGTLGEQQQMMVKVRHQPFGVYMKFIKPKAGQEVLYPSVKNPGKLVALSYGFTRRLGKFNLDPNGATAMDGNRYPITEAGIRNLTAKLVKLAESETKYAECDVKYSIDGKLGDRPVTMVQITHPVPRRQFKAHVARVFFDNEHRIPIGYQSYSWPTTPGGKPVLEKQYFYTRFQPNAGLTDADFDESNPNLFQ